MSELLSFVGVIALWLGLSLAGWAVHRRRSADRQARQIALAHLAAERVAQAGAVFDQIRRPAASGGGADPSGDTHALLRRVQEQERFFDEVNALRAQIRGALAGEDCPPLAELLHIRRDLWAASEIVLVEDVRALGPDFADDGSYQPLRAEALRLLFRQPGGETDGEDLIALRLSLAREEAGRFISAVEQAVSAAQEHERLPTAAELAAYPLAAARAFPGQLRKARLGIAAFIQQVRLVAATIRESETMARSLSELRRAREELPERFAAGLDKASVMARHGAASAKTHYDFLIAAYDFQAKYEELLRRAPEMTERGRQFIARLELAEKSERLKLTSLTVRDALQRALVRGLAHLIAGLQRLQTRLEPQPALAGIPAGRLSWRDDAPPRPPSGARRLEMPQAPAAGVRRAASLPRSALGAPARIAPKPPPDSASAPKWTVFGTPFEAAAPPAGVGEADFAAKAAAAKPDPTAGGPAAPAGRQPKRLKTAKAETPETKPARASVAPQDADGPQAAITPASAPSQPPEASPAPAPASPTPASAPNASPVKPPAAAPQLVAASAASAEASGEAAIAPASAPPRPAGGNPTPPPASLPPASMPNASLLKPAVAVAEPVAESAASEAKGLTASPPARKRSALRRWLAGKDRKPRAAQDGSAPADILPPHAQAALPAPPPESPLSAAAQPMAESAASAEAKGQMASPPARKRSALRRWVAGKDREPSASRDGPAPADILSPDAQAAAPAPPECPPPAAQAAAPAPPPECHPPDAAPAPPPASAPSPPEACNKPAEAKPQRSAPGKTSRLGDQLAKAKPSETPDEPANAAGEDIEPPVEDDDPGPLTRSLLRSQAGQAQAKSAPSRAFGWLRR